MFTTRYFSEMDDMDGCPENEPKTENSWIGLLKVGPAPGPASGLAQGLAQGHQV